MMFFFFSHPLYFLLQKLSFYLFYFLTLAYCFFTFWLGGPFSPSNNFKLPAFWFAFLGALFFGKRGVHGEFFMFFVQFCLPDLPQQ